MDEALSSAGKICIAIIAAAYLTFVVSNRIFNSSMASSTPAIVRDVIQKDEHHLYGKILVPRSCDEVSYQIENPAQNQYILAFTTWEEPSVVCLNTPTERVFDTVIFAPTIGTEFSATLDKTPLQLAVYPIISSIQD